MTRSIGTYTLALFLGIGLLPMALTSCSNPSSAPATSATNAVSYSASAFFNTESLGDTAKTPFPYCFPVTYLQQALGLTDSQAAAIQGIQDSLRLAMKSRLDAMKTAGTLTPDSARAIRMEFQTELYKDISSILTAAQLAQLQALAPPQGPAGHYDGGGRGRGHGDGRRGRDDHDTARPPANGPLYDSLMLVHLEQELSESGDTLTGAQVTLIQNAAASIRADTTLTQDGRRAAMNAQLQTILTTKEIADLRGDADHHRHR